MKTSPAKIKAANDGPRHQITFNASYSDYQRLRKLARETDISQTVYLNEGLNHILDKYELTAP